MATRANKGNTSSTTVPIGRRTCIQQQWYNSMDMTIMGIRHTHTRAFMDNFLHQMTSNSPHWETEVSCPSENKTKSKYVPLCPTNMPSFAIRYQKHWTFLALIVACACWYKLNKLSNFTVSMFVSWVEVFFKWVCVSIHFYLPIHTTKKTYHAMQKVGPRENDSIVVPNLTLTATRTPMHRRLTAWDSG